jgi:mono/diheme cytochrome c family protein
MVIVPGIADAAPPGQALAEQWCAECHAVKPGQASTNPDSPPFPALAADPSITELSLRVFLRTPHATMPNLILKPGEMDALVAYFVSLKPKS